MDSLTFAHNEEKVSKLKAIEIYDKNLLSDYKAGSFECLQFIHKHLFEDIYDFAGKIRTVNMSKGYTRFASAIYINEAISQVELMPQNTFEEIINKYIEMNMVHPFREGNGRATRIWLDHIFKHELKCVVDWSKIDKKKYLLAMELSIKSNTELAVLLKPALTKDASRNVFMKGIDKSYDYEGYNLYKAQDLH
ncbi:MAG: Fic family protein [Coriobacteriia bacterium]|nr:Fic family protein [Coriobacteriia bacterium]